MNNQNNYDDEIDFREYIEVLRKRWKSIAYLTIGLAAAALVFSLMQSPVYEAETTILLKSGGGGGSLAQFAGLAGLAGISLPSGSGNIGDITQLLQSQAVAAKVLDDLKLKERIKGWNDPQIKEQSLISGVRGMLKKPKMDGNLIDLKVEYSDPAMAAEIANGYASALSYYWNRLNYTEARKKREYIESQLPRVELDLKQAEQRFKQFTLLSPKSGVAAEGLMGTAYGSQSQGVELSRLTRELEIQNSIYTMLRKEYESVKLEESKEIAPFSVIDRAVKPESKSRPKVKLNAMIGLVLGLFSGVFLAFFQEYWEKSGSKA
jgi:uncharacterized protein involved in exopolysaccharide biosynthesis